MVADLEIYAGAFVATLALEVLTTIVLGLRQGAAVGAVMAVNIFSYPLLNATLWAIDMATSAPVGLAAILLLEAIVVVVEWQLLAFALPQQRKSSLFRLSLVMNAVSYLAGLTLFGHTG